MSTNTKPSNASRRPSVSSVHSLLERQLKKHFEALDTLPEELTDFVSAIDAAYREADEDRVMLERSLELSSQELLQANSDLRAEKERLTVTLHSIGEGVITTDTEGTITLINRVAQRLTGWPQAKAIGRPIDHVFHVTEEGEDGTDGTLEEPFVEVLESTDHVVPRGGMMVSRDGQRREVAYTMAPICDHADEVLGVVVAFRDVSEERKLEEERIQASRLESVGLLAGGIAHDFNNILTILLGNLSLAQAKMESNPESVHELLEEALRAGSRAKDLTHQLLTFSKGGAPIKTIASVGDLARESAVFALRGSNVRCEFKIDTDLFPVAIDKGQISQVVNNLIINADQAMPQGGLLEIGAKNLIAGQTDEDIPIEAERCVKVWVRDEGIGIPDDYIDRIFDPYFTTKQRGSGLGLATSYSVIKNHDGLLTVESQFAVGTTFYFYLPASQTSSSGQPVIPEAELQPGQGRLLVMDDEEPVLRLAQQMLQHLGYQVVTACHGEEALARFLEAKERQEPFDAIILDLTIPGGMGGQETAAFIIDLDTTARVVASSGYSNDPIMSDFTKYGFKAVLTKPYNLQEMDQALARVLGRST